MRHTCSCVYCTDPYPFDEAPRSEGHGAVRFGTTSRGHYEVRMNGERLSDCFEADARAGLAAVYAPDTTGRLHVLPCGHICSTLRRGQIELRRSFAAYR